MNEQREISLSTRSYVSIFESGSASLKYAVCLLLVNRF